MDQNVCVLYTSNNLSKLNVRFHECCALMEIVWGGRMGSHKHAEAGVSPSHVDTHMITVGALTKYGIEALSDCR